MFIKHQAQHSFIPRKLTLLVALALSGAAAGDKVAPAWPTAVTGQTGLSGIMAVSAADTILVRLCNLSGSAVDLGAATYGAAVLR